MVFDPCMRASSSSSLPWFGATSIAGSPPSAFAASAAVRASFGGISVSLM